MVLSRFWYLLLSVAVALCVAAVILVVRHHDAQASENLNDALGRDRFEIEAMLKLDARARIDAVAPVAADSNVRQLLRELSTRSDFATVDPAKFSLVSQRLVALNSELGEMRADLLLALDREGNLMGQVGGRAPNALAGLGEFPLVLRALEGFVRDDVWVYNGQVYRVAARPVIDAGQYVGAIVHGMAIDQRLAQRLSERVGGATVAFFRRDRVIASHMPTSAQGTLSTALEAKLDQAIGAPNANPVDLGDGSRAIYSLVSGSAAHAGVGYAIARPVPLIGSPFGVFERASAEDVASLNIPLLAGLAVGLFVFAMLLVWLEHDRTLNRLRAATGQLAAGKSDRVDPSQFGGRYRTIASNVNAALEKSGGKAPQRRRTTDLDDILGHNPSSPEPAIGQFDFQTSAPSTPSSAGSVASPTGRSSSAGALNTPVTATPVRAEPSSEPPTMIAQRPLAPPPNAASGRKPPPPPPRGPKHEAPTAVMTQPASLLTESTSGSVSVEAEEQMTMISQVPDELLRKSAAPSHPPDGEETHFREVFDQFVAMKKQCGESTVGLTYDKFLVTLRKNREQILKKHGARTVRFSVYMKEGKAALKATPIRD